MEYINGTKDYKLKHTAVALGKFDGLHIGHQVLFEKLKEYSRNGYTTVMFTFDFHPMSLLSGKKQELIYTKEERKKLVEEMGIDVLIEFPFTVETSHMTPEDFVRDILVGEIGAEAIIVGDDFHFGYKRSGDVDFLKSREPVYGFHVDNCRKLCINGEEISATMIRSLITEGNLELARELLGRPYMISGNVIRGKANGRKVSMPTANLAAPDTKLLPPDGVYASKTIVDGETFCSLTNIGRNPTISDHNELRIETFLLDFNGDLYDKQIEVYLYKFVRGEKKFSGLEELREQVSHDQLEVADYFRNLPPEI